MAPSKRRKTAAPVQPISGNATQGVRTRRSAGARGDVPDSRDADLDAEPEVLMCPITRTVFRDPVVLFDSGHTYERSAVLAHFRRNGAKDPLTRRALSSTKVMTNWAMRNVVQDWLDKHPGVTPDGWESHELLEPSRDDGTRMIDDEGDIGVLRTWRAMCPELQGMWPEEEPEYWVYTYKRVTMENGRVVDLDLAGFYLTGAVPAELGRMSALRHLDLNYNQLTSVPAEIGQLTSLVTSWLNGNLLTSLPTEIGQLTSLKDLSLYGNRLTSVPADIGQLTSLIALDLEGNQLTSVPAEIGQLASLENLYLTDNKLTSVPAEIGQLTSLKELCLHLNKLTRVPAEIGQLTSLKELWLSENKLTSLPAEMGQLTSLTYLNLRDNQLTSVPTAVRELRAAGCTVGLDDGVTVDE